MKNLFFVHIKSMALTLAVLFGATFYSTATEPTSMTADTSDHERLLQMVNDSSFVVEANLLQGRYGRTVPVIPNLNFVSVDGELATIQFEINNGQPGYNGLGGITIDGRLIHYEVSDKGEGKGVYVRMTIFGTGGTYDLYMNVNDSYSATIDVRNIRGGSLQYWGDLMPTEKSSAYKGNPTF